MIVRDEYRERIRAVAIIGAKPGASSKSVLKLHLRDRGCRQNTRQPDCGESATALSVTRRGSQHGVLHAGIETPLTRVSRSITVSANACPMLHAGRTRKCQVPPCSIKRTIAGKYEFC